MRNGGNHVSRGWANTPAVFVTAAAISLFLLSATGCSSSPRPTGIIYAGSMGAVTLEATAHREFKATHPVSVNPTTLARVLHGVQIREQASGVFPSGTDEQGAAPAFSDEDIGFLAPLLSTALSQAGRENHLAFRVIRSIGSRPVVTAGNLYAHRSYLYLTLTHFQYEAHDPGILYQSRTPLPYSTALTRKTVRFVPEAAGKPTNTQPTGGSAHPTLTTLAIDYRRVAALSTYTLVPESRRSGRKKSQVAHKSAGRQDEELRALKRTIQALRKRLTQRDQLIKKLTNKK